MKRSAVCLTALTVLLTFLLASCGQGGGPVPTAEKSDVRPARLMQKRYGHGLLEGIGRREDRGAGTHINRGRSRVFGIHSCGDLLSENEKKTG